MDRTPSRNLLDRSELLEIEYKPATRGQRLANYLLDLITFALMLMLFFLVVGVVLGDDGVSDESAPDTSDSDLFVNLIFYGLYALYYTLFEAALGKTPGKMLTRTRVIGEDGQPISMGRALGRSLGRFIPFNGVNLLFSSGGRTLHDTVSKTWVVQDLPQNSGPTQLTAHDPETQW